MTEVFRLCDDYLTRWAALDPVAAGMVGLSGVFGAATDYGPDGSGGRSAGGVTLTGSRPGPSSPLSSTRECPAITCRRVRP
jgi:hypothetical protein